MTVLLLGAVAAPRVAEAQARGTLQATARVVDTRTSFASLEAARGAVQSTVNPQASQQRPSTVAQVSVQRSEDRRSAVVTIDYSRN